MAEVVVHSGPYPEPIPTLERLFDEGGVTLVQAVFANTFFAAPEKVRATPVRHPGFARKSRHHYPGLGVGEAAVFGGREVRLDSNSRAQNAWSWYSGRPLERASGYGVRHIFGHPWDPVGYSAGWNLAYMPFWAGMLTEDQHPHHLIRAAIKQAGWDLYFGDEPVCEPPDFVADPGLDLDEVLNGQPLLVVQAEEAARPPVVVESGSLEERVVGIRRQVRNSWSNLRKAAADLAGRDHPPFSTPNVAATSKSHVRRMIRETGATLEEIAAVLEAAGSD